MTSDGARPAVPDRPALPEHLPMRPLWLCRRCGQPWPCGRARLALLAEYRQSRLSLLLYLAGLMYEAIDDLHRLYPSTSGDVRDLFDRFLGWPPRNRFDSRPGWDNGNERK